MENFDGRIRCVLKIQNSHVLCHRYFEYTLVSLINPNECPISHFSLRPYHYLSLHTVRDLHLCVNSQSWHLVYFFQNKHYLKCCRIDTL